MPLNEMPLVILLSIEQDLIVAYNHWNDQPNKPVSATLQFLNAVRKAIKDVEFEQSKR